MIWLTFAQKQSITYFLILFLIRLTIDDKDPPWFNTKIKSLLQEKHKIYKHFRKDRYNTQLLRKLEHLQNRLNNSIDSSKHNYCLRMANKLNSIQKSSKAYWSLLKSFINNKKIPIIPSILHNNALVTDFKKKAELSTLTLSINAL